MGLREAINDEMKWGCSENGADILNTTGSKRLDFFAQAGSMRGREVVDKCTLFDGAFSEDARDAIVLLFHTRNPRGGYGERDTFLQILRHLANQHPDIVELNLWAIVEFGRAKDLYSLIDTKAEEAMWHFMKEQFELDYANMKDGKSISLLAKWIATPDSKSSNTKELGKLTAKKLGYSSRRMREYKDKLREMRRYLDLPEAKMCDGRWDEIEYSKCASRFLLTHRKAFVKHDKLRWDKYLDNVKSGTSKMNTSVLNPCDIFMKAYQGDNGNDLDVMWNNLKIEYEDDILAIIDTSGSMWWPQNKAGNMYPGAVAWSLGLLTAQRNKGCLHNLCMVFDDISEFIEFNGTTLEQHIRTFKRHTRYGSTNLEDAFELLLRTAINGNLEPDEMPKAMLIISDMQVNKLEGFDGARITFYDAMAKKYEEAGYKLPQVIFWNVAVREPSFLAPGDKSGISLVSGYSTTILSDVMRNQGTTPYELMRAIIDSEMYKGITVTKTE